MADYEDLEIDSDTSSDGEQDNHDNFDEALTEDSVLRAPGSYPPPSTGIVDGGSLGDWTMLNNLRDTPHFLENKPYRSRYEVHDNIRG